MKRAAKSILLVNKPVGMTPLEVIYAIKKSSRVAQNETIGYAGRLDPMAEGLLLLLLGEENKKRKSYERLPKTYTVDVLFGLSTDTYDTLGIITSQKLDVNVDAAKLQSILNTSVGTFEQPYPPYSSARVNGKPLFWWTRNNRLNEVTIPTKTVTIDTITLCTIQTRPLGSLRQSIMEKLQSVHGTFRQEIITPLWQRILDEHNQEQVTLATIEVSCSSGTYMRSLAHDAGKKLGCGAFAFAISRTQIGPYRLLDAIRLPEATFP